MIATFITFIVSILLTISFKMFNFLTRKNDNKFIKVINKFSNIILLIFSGIIIFTIYAINNFKEAFVNQNEWMINISLLSYLMIYSFIIAFFIGIILFIPFRTLITIKNYKDNFSLLKNNLKLFFIFGTLLVLICTIMYAFDDNIIKLDYNYDKITTFQSILIPHYHNLNNVVNLTVKSEWVPWVLIAYTLLWMLINYLLVSKRKHFLNDNFITKVNNIFSLTKYIFPIFSFISIISTFILSWQSFFIRCAILLLVMIIFTAINFLLKFILKSKDNNEMNFFVVKDFMNNVIISILFMFYLTISSSKILYVLSPAQHVNLWFSIYFSSLLISIVYVSNPNHSTNRIFACVNTVYISSGINTFALYFFAPILDLFSHINSQIVIKNIKLY